MKNLSTLAFGLIMVVAFAPVAAGGTQQGNHVGDSSPLKYEIVYKEAYGTLTIDESGATYCLPLWDWTFHESISYSPEYFGTYPVYLAGRYVGFEIHIKNESNRTYRNLKVIATQEYHFTDGTTDGTIMPGNPTREWFVSELRGNQEIVLNGRVQLSFSTLPGLDQTHVQVLHWVNGNQVQLNAEPMGARADGRIFVDDAEAGVYCPPAFTVI